MSAAERTAAGEEALPDTPEPELEAGEAAPEELAAAVRELTDRIEALQADVRRLGGPGLTPDEPVWNDEDAGPTAPSYTWMSSVTAPVRRRPAVPRLLLEVLFLVAVATAAGVAELDAPAIVAVMVGAWVLVALIEWAAARAELRRDAVPVYAHVPPAAPGPLPADAAWFVPPVEQTLVETSDAGTAVTLLPPAMADVDATVDQPPGT